MSIQMTSFTRNLLATAAAATISLTMIGCGAGSPFVATNALNSAVSGRAMGGQQAVTGSSVQVWSAGVAGYGSQATLLATTTTDTTGYFSFAANAYACPTTPATTPLYITATGGNPGNSSGNSNGSIVLVAMLGQCAAAESATVNINEITTIASAYAMSGFIKPANFGLSSTTAAGDSIGSSYSATPTFAANNNNINGLNNAVNTAAVLANISTGASPGTTANGTIDVAKINTLANILASCVNSDPTGGSTSCSTLFTDVSPAVTAAAPTATNTFEAAYYLCQNPTNSASSVTTVNNLAAASAPFAPTLSAAPTDWTVGINYTAAGMTAGQRLAIDATGNVWVTSANSTSGGQVTEFGPTGSVLSTFTGTFGTNVLTAPMGIAVDRASILTAGASSNNVAVADSGTNGVLIFNEKNGYLQTVAGSATANEEPYAVTFGQDLGLYFTETTTNAVTGTQTAIAVKAAYSTTNQTYGLIGTDKTNAAGPFDIVANADTTNPTLFVVGEYQLLTSTTSNSGAIRNFTALLAGNANTYANTTKAEFPIAMVFDSYGDAVFSNADYALSGGQTYGPNTPQGPTQSFISGVGTTVVTGGNPDTLGTAPKPTAFGAGGLNNARYLAIDGNDDVWVANAGGYNNGTTTTYSVSEFLDGGNVTPVALSPATTGFVHTMSAPNDLATDGSGNVWVVSGGACELHHGDCGSRRADDHANRLQRQIQHLGTKTIILASRRIAAASLALSADALS